MTEAGPFSELESPAAGCPVPSLARPPHLRRSLTRNLLPAILIAVMLFGLFLRVEDFRDWRKSAGDIAFYDGKPLLGALDGYFYLRLARDILEHTYASSDPLRNAPNGFPRPSPPPLLACLTAGICRSTGWQLDWVGFFLPAFLGTLLAIPLFALGRYLSCSATGITAALAGLVAPYVVYRGGMGWLDTDCMNAAWTLATAYCFMRFSHGKVALRYAWLLGGFACTALFFWWWDQAPGVVLLISLAPLAIGAAFFYRPRRRAEIIGLTLVAISMIALGVVHRPWLYHHLESIAVVARGQFQHVIRPAPGDLADFARGISEQSAPSFDYVLRATTCSVFFFVLSVLGLLLLTIRKTGVSVFLLPVAALGVLGLYSERFLLFLAPLLALGLGYIIGGIWRLRRWHGGFAAAAIGVGGLALLPPLHTLLTTSTAWPKTDASRVAGMVQLEALTPTNAVIWTGWDNGYAVNYFARRATLHDGQLHGSELSRYAAIPLVTTNAEAAARLMQFYAAQGAPGMRTIRPERMDDPAAYPVPATGRPVYLFLDSMTLETAALWLPFGLGGTNSYASVYHPMFGLVLKPGEGVYAPEGRIIDMTEGVLCYANKYFGLRHIIVREATSAWITEYERTNGGCFELVVPGGFGVVMNSELAESVFNRLFVRMDPAMAKWFTTVVNRSPEFQIWRVLP